MLRLELSPSLLKKLRKIRDKNTKERVKKQIERIIENPEIGKPMRFARKGTLEVYVSPYRLAYAYLPGTVIFLDVSQG